MARRVASMLPFALLLAVSLFPAAVSAHGPRLKGVEIDRGITLRSVTGDCVCDTQWFTVGLKQGPVSFSGRLQSCNGGLAPSCGVNAFLYRGIRLLGSTNGACPKSNTRCGAKLKIKTRIRTGGAYYLMIQGTGALRIKYTLHVKGNIYALHCRTYC